MDIDPILKALAAALHGEGPAVEIVTDADGKTSAVPVETGVEDAALVVRTSGSTGVPKATVLTIDALAASSVATAMALRGEGQWLLALPLQYVAGAQVLVRSLYAGTRPWVMDQSNGFTPEAFTAAAEELTDKIRFTSLVPTQLQRLLDSPSPATLAVLRRFNAILLGGAPASPELLATAHAEGLNVVTTYGSAETCGGCVYDGEPLDGVEIRLGEGELEGRVLLGGATVAAGYLNGGPEAFFEDDGTRWYVTGDLGELSPDGKLTVLGRADDVIITGGVKASAAYIQSKLEELDGVNAAFVAGVPSREWGQAVAAYIAVDDPSREGISGFTARRETALGILAPKTVLADKELLMLPNGKPDRLAMIELLSNLHQGQ
ncbi:AMP-binding protein [Paenarthrobacter nicotinovorans]|uniref:AMP-binding protein n=1 Tax=Paenarthrobacter nicotinovorans TaxID=29320 RepID=UPI0027865762|nr:AMP-binding protein [Paenarthrobacter nicotinovorans]MDP9936227.1 O-succinylbenzoic acid--CoA ligase [Paenarthrobacter nicotinovorans]